MGWSGEDWTVIGLLLSALVVFGVVALALFTSGSDPDDDWPTGIGA